MKFTNLFSLLLSFVLLSGCQAARIKKDLLKINLNVTGQIEITSHRVEKTSDGLCSIEGKIMNENQQVMFGLKAILKEINKGAVCDMDGVFKITDIPVGIYTLELNSPEVEQCTVTIDIAEGEHLKFEAIIDRYAGVEILKPIIYLYPEKKMEVEVELMYDGKITTTYPKHPADGWKVTASPDGTLIDGKNKEYYALYWEGEPRKPLGMDDGFVVSNEQTVPFLEEKLAQLGLNARESNEFIIYWLPILERNKFNLIHFAGDDYLEQAKLTISPKPETIIRVAMVFKGLEEEIKFPIQDLTPLIKTRSGFTAVEWGGQELPKEYKLGI